jgi:hypothetical protein
MVVLRSGSNVPLALEDAILLARVKMLGVETPVGIATLTFAPEPAGTLKIAKGIHPSRMLRVETPGEKELDQKAGAARCPGSFHALSCRERFF